MLLPWHASIFGRTFLGYPVTATVRIRIEKTFRIYINLASLLRCALSIYIYIHASNPMRHIKLIALRKPLARKFQFRNVYLSANTTPTATELRVMAVGCKSSKSNIIVQEFQNRTQFGTSAKDSFWSLLNFFLQVI